jgi:uncharacterized membrane protein YebE (DUF533 family)
MPLGAIFILGGREGQLTAHEIEKIPGVEALVHLAGNTYVNYLLDRTMREQEFDALSRLVRAVPVRSLRPQADPSRLTNLCEDIARNAMAIVSFASTPSLSNA